MKKKSEWIDANGNRVPDDVVAAHPEMFRKTRYHNMPKTAPKVNAVFKDPDKDSAEDSAKVLPLLLAGGAGLAGYHVAQTIIDSIDDDGKKDKPMWRRVLSTLIPLGVAGASAYGGYRIGMPVKKAQSREDRLASQNPIPIWNKEVEDSEFGTPENPVTPYGRYLEMLGLLGGTGAGGLYTKHQVSKYLEALKFIGATSGEIAVATDKLKDLRKRLRAVEDYNSNIEKVSPQAAVDAQTHMTDINLRLKALSLDDPRRIKLKKEYDNWLKTFRENSVVKKDTSSILNEIAENEKIISSSRPNPELSWKRFSGRRRRLFLAGLGHLHQDLVLHWSRMTCGTSTPSVTNTIA